MHLLFVIQSYNYGGYQEKMAVVEVRSSLGPGFIPKGKFKVWDNSYDEVAQFHSSGYVCAGICCLACIRCAPIGMYSHVTQ